MSYPLLLCAHEAAPPAVTLTRADTPSPSTIAQQVGVEEESAFIASSKITRTPLSTPVSTLTEDGENGSGNVIIDTGAVSYTVLQDNIASQGDYAFYLNTPIANNAAHDASVTLTTPIAVTAETSLFFESWLRIAFVHQFARVRLSTDGGNSWPHVIYEQAGLVPASGTPQAQADTSFSLREVDLSPYAGQTIRLQFSFEFGNGFSAFGNSLSAGWYIDNIQIGTSFTKRPYSIGDPTDEEQLYLELINRARADAAAEAQLLKNTTDADVLNAINFFNVDLDEMVAQFATLDQTVQPLSFNEKLIASARLHSQDMFNNTFQGHVSSSNPVSPNQAGDSIGDRITRQGYVWSTVSENVFSFADTVFYGHAGFNIDWGNGAFGMQVPPGHRLSIHNNAYKEAGVGVFNGSKTGPDWTNNNASTTVGPQLVTQNFGRSQEDAAFITGVVFDDADGDKFYDEGEGVGGVRVDVEGSFYYAISSDSGGYSVPVSTNGNHTVTFTAAGFNDYEQIVSVNNLENVKVDWRRLKVTVSQVANSPSDLLTISFRAENHSPSASFRLLKSSTPGGPYSEVPGAVFNGPTNGVSS
ncbi:MAG: CAP domain-containing protein, partial [Verrucomicrobiota bacterium]